MDIHAKLKELGLTLPAAPKPVAAYIPSVQSGNLLFVSGQLPMDKGALIATGPVPGKVGIKQAQLAARQCALNALAVVDAALAGDWSRFRRAVRIGVFVSSDADFTDQPKVADGVSELLGAVFGEAGRHARAAVGVNVLPRGATVEAEFVFEVEPRE